MKYPESISTAAQYLKKTIPHLVNNKLPANPINYTLWYNYIAGHIPELSRALDQLIASNGTYSEAESKQLYFHYIIRKHLESSHLTLEGISEMASHLLECLAQSASGSAEFDQQLGSGLERLKSASSISEINALVAEIIATTETIKTANHQFRKNIEEANREIASLHLKLNEAEKHAYIDQLTQLYNRHAFDRQLNQLLDTEAVAKNVCLLLTDLDHFKSFNDDYGHVIGDRVLHRMGELLQDHCPENAICARYGGEEFAIIITNSTVEDAAAFAEKLRQRVHSLRVKIKNSDKVLDNISASFGIARFEPGETAESFIDRADQALYRAKNSGRNRVEIF